RFRNYLRICLGNLVADYHRRRQRRPEGLGDREPELSDPPPEDELRYQQVWREDLLARALHALDRHEQRTGQRLYSVLKLKMDHPEWRMERLVEELSRSGAGPVSADWVRLRLFRARAKLCELLRLEVKQTLREPTEEQVDEELAELGLLEYVRPAS